MELKLATPRPSFKIEPCINTMQFPNTLACYMQRSDVGRSDVVACNQIIYDRPINKTLPMHSKTLQPTTFDSPIWDEPFHAAVRGNSTDSCAVHFSHGSPESRILWSHTAQRGQVLLENVPALLHGFYLNAAKLSTIPTYSLASMMWRNARAPWGWCLGNILESRVTEIFL